MVGLFDLTGRTALVTGSSRGLGRAMAQGLAEPGAALVLNGADAGRLAEAAAALRAAGHTVHEAPGRPTTSPARSSTSTAACWRFCRRPRRW